jgi:diacylglycerol O-acyltransferase
VLVWAPVSGSVGMTVSIFSYHDSVTIGLLVDAGLVPDPQAIVLRVEQELEDLAGLAPATDASDERSIR